MSYRGFRYKGYIGMCRIDEGGRIMRGHVINSGYDTITFQGATIDEARASFLESVKKHLASTENEMDRRP